MNNPEQIRQHKLKVAGNLFKCSAKKNSAYAVVPLRLLEKRSGPK